jgi:hypothetical protein
VGFQAVEHCADEAGEGDGCGEASDDADDCEPGAFAEDHEEDLTGASSEGHADADLVGAASYVVGHDAVDADAGEDKGEDAEPSGEGGEEALLRDGVFDLLVLCAEVAEWEVLVDGLDGVAERRNDGGEGQLSFDGVVHELPVVGLLVEDIESGRGCVAKFIVLGVAGDTDDLVDIAAGDGVIVVGYEGLSDRVNAWKGAAGERLVDDRYARRGSGVGVAKGAPVEDGNAVSVDEVGADAVEVCIGLLFFGPVGEAEFAVGHGMGDESFFDSRDGVDARDLGEALFDALMESDVLWCGITGGRRLNGEEEKMMGIEAKVCGVEVDK